MSDSTHTLVATLGGQPQIVTFTLDLLLQRNIPISEVIVIHPEPSNRRLQHALACLHKEFVGDYYAAGKRIIHFRSHVLRLGDTLLKDISDEVSANGALNTIHGLIRDLKPQLHPIHLSISGGRRLMSLLAISAALLNFDHTDHIWHLYTPDDIKPEVNEGKQMHIPPGANVQLIEGPFAFLGPYFPHLPQQPHPDAHTVLNSQIADRDEKHHKRCETVFNQATPRQRDVLHAFAKGLEPQEVAEVLHITLGTVDAHKTKLLDYSREAWEVNEEKRLSYHFLYKNFVDYPFNDEYNA